MFFDLKLSDAGNFGRTPDIAWWPKAELAEMAHLAQEHLLRHPGTYGLRACSDKEGTRHLDGVRRTAYALSELKGNPLKQSAILRLAVIESNPTRGGQCWAVATSTAFQIRDELRQQLGFESGERTNIWQSANTSLLPPIPLSEDTAYHPCLELWREDLVPPVACLAEIDRQATLVLDTWQLVRLTYAADAADSAAVLAAFSKAPAT